MTIRVTLIDGPRQGTDQAKLESDGSAPDSGETFELDGTTYTFTGTVQADPDGHDRYHATKGSVELFHWFKGLRSSTRLRLLAKPDGPVPGGVVSELAASAPPPIGQGTANPTDSTLPAMSSNGSKSTNRWAPSIWNTTPTPSNAQGIRPEQPNTATPVGAPGMSPAVIRQS